MKKYYVYLARCKDNSLYTGYTVDLASREEKHNAGEGAKYTKSRLPIKIIYSEVYSSISEAMQREAEIKKLAKSEKEKLIKN